MTCGLLTSTGLAQPASPASAAQGASASSSDDETVRPATTTFFGDTGIWFVPTAEVLAKGKWSISGYRRGTNYIQGYTNVADFAGTAAIGIANRLEVFGSFLFDTRIDRDVRPLFINNSSYGGVIDRYPKVHQPWIGNHVGDLYVGAKVNLLSESTGAPAAFAVRGIVKIPTGDSDVGASTGKADVSGDVIASKEVARLVDVAGYVGYEHRGKPDGFNTPNGAFRWGAGTAFPSRSPIRGFVEVNGNVPSNDTASITTASLVGTDGSLPPIVSDTENLTRATAGITVQIPKGFFVGGGASWNMPRKDRNLAQAQDDPTADYWDFQVRIGFHPGSGGRAPSGAQARASTASVAGGPGAGGPPSAPPSPANRPPTVRAQCDPCTVEVGRTSTVTANAQDPDGDALMYRWSAPSGTFLDQAARSTTWTAPGQEGSVPVTVTVNDGKGGTASDTVTIQVTRPPTTTTAAAPPGGPGAARTYRFEDVYFDFDRYSLTPQATRVLDQAVQALQADPTLRVEIDGHTCNIGTSEYNLALGDRRANAVRDYLVSRGIAVNRLQTVSYGEEQPKYDNSREETRRLNRRAALVVNLERPTGSGVR